jgi:hypothetical protein
MDASASKIGLITSHGAYALKTLYTSSSRGKSKCLAKVRAYGPCYIGPQHWLNAETTRPTSVVPPLHEAA